jgi:hypothetical protein
LTLAGIVSEVRPLELNAKSAISSTPLGIMAFPVHSSLLTTTLLVIVKFPEPVTDPSVTQFIAPSAKAFAGLNTKPDSANASEVTRIKIRRIVYQLSLVERTR